MEDDDDNGLSGARGDDLTGDLRVDLSGDLRGVLVGDFRGDLTGDLWREALCGDSIFCSDLLSTVG